MGKGKRQGQMGDQDKAYANKQEGVQDVARGKADSIADSYTATAPGQMSPYASAQYGSDVENINRVYGNLRQGAYKALGASGFGRAPAGREASMLNTLGRGEAEDLTGAFRAGLGRTENQRDKALGYRTGEQAMYNPTGAREAATGSYAASDQARAQSFNTGLGILEAGATGFMPKAGGGGGMPNFGGLPGGSATNTPGLPLGALNQSMSSFDPMSSGKGFDRLSRFAKTGPGTWGAY